jgi:3-deoxy-manno-octulosonate cytidylyltransferase (CMP-KDO synthetase)
MVKNIHSLGIIPARFASTRFPGKPLVEIGGKSMIQLVYEQACKSTLDEVVVATDDERIFNHIKELDGRVVMTSTFHKSGTDRCAEVAALPEYDAVNWVVNIQGDEPFIQPEQIDLVLSFLQNNSSFPISTLAKKIAAPDKLFDPNTVKVAFDKMGRALYFSRSPIPFVKNADHGDWLANATFFKHIGIYGFTKETLLAISKLPVSSLENAESLEQLRWLENGFPIGVQVTEKETIGIDTPSDLEKISRFL